MLDLDALRDKFFGDDGCEILPEIGPCRALYPCGVLVTDPAEVAACGGSSFQNFIEFAFIWATAAHAEIYIT